MASKIDQKSILYFLKIFEASSKRLRLHVDVLELNLGAKQGRTVSPPPGPPPGVGLHTFSGSGLLLGECKGGGVPEIALTRQMTPKGVGGFYVCPFLFMVYCHKGPVRLRAPGPKTQSNNQKMDRKQ